LIFGVEFVLLAFEVGILLVNLSSLLQGMETLGKNSKILKISTLRDSRFVIPAWNSFLVCWTSSSWNPATSGYAPDQHTWNTSKFSFLHFIFDFYEKNLSENFSNQHKKIFSSFLFPSFGRFTSTHTKTKLGIMHKYQNYRKNISHMLDS
jgi:hypothetical protein